MKQFLLILCAGIISLLSCKKTNNVSARVLFYNASWSLPAIAASLNGTSVIANPLAPGQGSGTADSPYVQVPAGTNAITVNTSSTNFLDKNIYAPAASGTSFIFFDTSKLASPARMLQLTDDLALPDTFQLKYRVLNLVPDTAFKVDIWLVNGSIDSMRLDTASVFAGSTVAASSLQTFKVLSFHGGSYTVKVKKTGTQEVSLSLASYPFAINGIYTVILSGLVPGSGNTGFKLSVLRHPPG